MNGKFTPSLPIIALIPGVGCSPPAPLICGLGDLGEGAPAINRRQQPDVLGEGFGTIVGSFSSSIY